MEFKGTKGKWRACCIESSPHYIFAHEDNITICRPYMEQESAEDLDLQEYRANALLISKAPEMLEMLNNFYNNMKIGRIPSNALSNLEKLIKEATEL